MGDFIINGLVITTPLMIAAMGDVISERSGVLNMGLEGMMLAGAFFSHYFAILTNNPWLGIICGMLAALLIGVIYSVAAVNWNLNQVVVAVAINMICLGLTSTLIKVLFPSSNNPSDFVSPAVSPWFFIAMAGVLFFIATVVMNYTTWGLKIRACGEYPVAAQTMGVKVKRVRFLSVLYSSAVAGLAGASLTLGNVHIFAENMTSGKGFIAFACIIFGRFNPANTLLGCLIFGFADNLKFVLQVNKIELPGGYITTLILPYLITVLMLIFSKRGATPKAWGAPFENMH
jgi:simple sugar transport system permease protein